MSHELRFPTSFTAFTSFKTDWRLLLLLVILLIKLLGTLCTQIVESVFTLVYCGFYGSLIRDTGVTVVFIS